MRFLPPLHIPSRGGIAATARDHYNYRQDGNDHHAPVPTLLHTPRTCTPPRLSLKVKGIPVVPSSCTGRHMAAVQVSVQVQSAIHQSQGVAKMKRGWRERMDDQRQVNGCVWCDDQRFVPSRHPAVSPTCVVNETMEREDS